MSHGKANVRKVDSDRLLARVSHACVRRLWRTFLRRASFPQRAGRRQSLGKNNRIFTYPSLAVVEMLEPHILLSTVTWTNSSGGDWAMASNWSTDTVPGSGDTAVISGLTSGAQVTYDSGTSTVTAIEASSPLQITGGSLTVSDSVQAILNLAVNSRDAMPNGGRLTIETANALLDEGYVAEQSEVVPGRYVMLAITDNGIGMSSETRAKAFDPFFTTKDVGHGTGLGLSRVYGFVKQSGGHLKIYSELGEGTTVRIYLPRLYTEEPAAPEEPIARVVHGNENEAILVVEDDDDVRAHTCATLHELGYRVWRPRTARARWTRSIGGRKSDCCSPTSDFPAV